MTPTDPTPPAGELRERIDDIIDDARNEAYQAGGNDTNMDLRDYTGEIMAAISAAFEAALPPQAKNAQWRKDNHIESTLWDDGYDQAIDDTRANFQRSVGKGNV